MKSGTDMRRHRRRSLKKTILIFLVSIAALLAFRWILFEPYVVPSGSMIPNLLIHDHILVSKWAYGLRWPFSKKWMFQGRLPKRGEITVFRSVDNDDLYMVKRVVGLPGDKIEVKEDGRLFINGEPTLVKPLTKMDEDQGSQIEYRLEKLGDTEFVTRHYKEEFRSPFVTEVPEGHIFFMGDNRDQSRDSRAWGAAPRENLLGRVIGIWLSCEETLEEAPYICDFSKLRWERMFSRPGTQR